MKRRLFTFPWRSRHSIDADVDAELAFHLQSRVAELESLGLTRADAEATARREFGDVEDARQYMVHMDRQTESTQRRRDHVHELLQDMKYALRRMRSAPVFTITAVATLALGIGANTAVFSVVDAALLRPLPYPNADRLTSINDVAPFGPFVTSPPNFVDYRAQSRSFTEMSALYGNDFTLTGAGEPRSISGAVVSHGFFQVFGVAPAIGRTFAESEEQDGNTDYVVLSNGLWREAFGSRADIIGHTIQLDGKATTVVGVMPPGFNYPGRTQLWTPLAFTTKQLQTQRGAHYLDVVALLKPNVSVETADRDVRGIATRLATEYPGTNKDYTASVISLRDALVGSASRRALVVLLVSVALVALIACANVANLVLARGTARGREIAVRLALGATRQDLLFMALTESVLLSLIGGAAGLVLAKGLAGVLDGLRPSALRDVGDLQINMTAAAFTFLISLVAGVLFGLAPALQAMRRRNLQPALQAGGRAELGERHTGVLRSTLVAAEIALAVVLLSGAGLLIKSFTRLQQVDAGFDPRNLLVFSVSLPDARYETDVKKARAVDDLMQRVSVVPGVASTGAFNMLPLDGNSYSISTRSIDGSPIASEDQPSTQVRVVTPGALKTLGIRLRQGRDFETSDRMGSTPVVLANEAAAKLLWKGVNPLGHSVVISTRFRDDTTRAGGVIVGIVADIRDRSLGQAPRPTLYFPHAQAPWSSVSVVVRAAPGMQSAALVSPIRDQLRAMDPLLPLVDPRSMDDVARVSVAQPRFATVLMSTFASLAVLLAVIGVFGVMAYVVGQRTREIGIRIALGASQQRVVGETLTRAATPLLVGVGLGLVGTLLAVRLLDKMLYDVAPRDPAVLGAVVVGLTLVALLAAYLPARRASTVDPLLALRSD